MNKNQVTYPAQVHNKIKKTKPSTKAIAVHAAYNHQACIKSPNTPLLNLTEILLNLRAAFGKSGTQAAFKISYKS